MPILRWAPQWREPGTVRADLLAGLTNAIVVLPQGFAFATIAGMPVQYGLYAAMVPCLVAALFGSSRLMVTGPANAISLTTLALLAPLAEPGSARYVELAITLAFLVGIVQLALGLARAGRFVDIVPHSVIVGFTAGAAVLIAVAQLGPFLGIELPRGLSVVATFQGLLQRLADLQPLALVSGLITVLTIIVWKPWNRRLPAVLMGVIVGSAAAALLQHLWPQAAPLRVVPPLPAVVPPLSWPDLSWGTLALLPGPVAVMTLLALTEALAIARAVALKSHDVFDDSQEFRAQGLANITGSFFSAFPTSGSFNRSGVNLVSGARTPLAAASAALFLVALLLIVGPLATLLPYCVVAGLLFMVAWGLIDRPEIARLWQQEPAERIPLVATFIATLTLSLEWAILIGLLSAWITRRLVRQGP